MLGIQPPTGDQIDGVLLEVPLELHLQQLPGDVTIHHDGPHEVIEHLFVAAELGLDLLDHPSRGRGHPGGRGSNRGLQPGMGIAGDHREPERVPAVEALDQLSLLQARQPLVEVADLQSGQVGTGRSADTRPQHGIVLGVVQGLPVDAGIIVVGENGAHGNIFRDAPFRARRLTHIARGYQGNDAGYPQACRVHECVHVDVSPNRALPPLPGERAILPLLRFPSKQGLGPRASLLAGRDDVEDFDQLRDLEDLVDLRVEVEQLQMAAASR